MIDVKVNSEMKTKMLLLYFLLVQLLLMPTLANTDWLRWSRSPDAQRSLHSRAYVNAGNRASLLCPAEGNPDPLVTWYKDGRLIDLKASKRITMRRKFGRLVISNTIEPGDSGMYTCVASNTYGALNHTVLLTVLPALPGQRPIVPELGNQTAHEGATVTFSCPTKSGTVPLWDWFRVINGTDELIDGLLRDSSRTSLVLTNVTLEDSGQYACEVTNIQGTTRRTAWLIVVTAPERRVVIHAEIRHWLVVLVVGGVLCLMIIVTIVACRQRRTRLSKMLVRLPMTHVDNAWYVSSDDDTSFLIPWDASFEFPRCNLQLGEMLGEGAFGKVVKGYALGLHGDNETTVVAVKMLKEGVPSREVIDMVSEMDIMKTIGSHPNVVTFHGCCSRDGPLLLLVEFACYGNLRHFLYNRRPSNDDYLSTSHYLQPVTCHTSDSPHLSTHTADLHHLSHAHLLSFCYQVARGMDYIASKNIVHRDLAARNVLVASNFVLKISDFGLTRDVGDAEYYRKTSRGLLPVKWMAPEALLDRKYTTKSDVWSYGVLLWEIFTYGGTPYPSVPVENLHKLLSHGYRMDKPLHADDETYKTMQSCWHAVPEERPTFSQLVEQFDTQLVSASGTDYLSVAQSMGDLADNEMGSDDVFDSPQVEDGGRLTGMGGACSTSTLAIGRQFGTGRHGKKSRCDSQYSSLSDYPSSAAADEDAALHVQLQHLPTADVAVCIEACDGSCSDATPGCQGDDKVCVVCRHADTDRVRQWRRRREDSCLPSSITDSSLALNDSR